MTLAEFLTTNPEPIAEQTDGLVIVFSAELATTLAAIQVEHGDPRYQVSPISLADGRKFLSADVLTEIKEGGLFYPAYSHLDQETFSSAEIVPFAEVGGLIHESEE